MLRKCLLNVVAWTLIIGLLTLTAPIAFAAAPVQDQQETSAVASQSPMLQVVVWFVGVWEKLIVWLPDPGTTTVPPQSSESGSGSPDIGPGIEPNGGS